MIAQQPLLWMYSPNQQKISEHRFFLLFEKVLGREIRDGDRHWFVNCATVEQFIYRALDSQFFQAIGLEDNPIGKARLIEFYVCLRCDLNWEPRAGFDAYGAFKYQEEIKAGKIEVKHGGMGKRDQWCVQITGREKRVKADVLVFVGMPKVFNPCEGTMLVIPAEALSGEVERQLKRNPERIPEIYINKCKRASHIDTQNRWYKYELVDHTLLKDRLSQYVHGAPITLCHQQISMF